MPGDEAQPPERAENAAYKKPNVYYVKPISSNEGMLRSVGVEFTFSDDDEGSALKKLLETLIDGLSIETPPRDDLTSALEWALLILVAEGLPPAPGFYRRSEDDWELYAQSDDVYLRDLQQIAFRRRRSGMSSHYRTTATDGFVELVELARRHDHSGQLELAALVVWNLHLYQLATVNQEFSWLRGELAFAAGQARGTLAMCRQHSPTWSAGDRSVGGGRAAAEARHGSKEARAARDSKIAQRVASLIQDGHQKMRAYELAGAAEGVSDTKAKRCYYDRIKSTEHRKRRPR